MYINWARLNTVYKELSDTIGLDEDIIITISFTSNINKTVVIPLKNLLPFMWAISNNKEIMPIMLLVQDKNGNLLYRHKKQNRGQEIIPPNTQNNLVVNWQKLSLEEQKVYVKLLISQIESY